MENAKAPPEPHDPGGAARRARVRRRAIGVAEHLALLALAGAFLWRGFFPAWKTLNTDFPDYYLAARLYHRGYSLENLYDWTWVQRQKDHAEIQRPIVTFTLLTPFSLLPVLPFSSLPPLQAKRCWLLVNLVLLALVAWLLRQMTQLKARHIGLLIFLCMIPLRTNFVFGQEYILLLLLLTLAAWFYLRKQPVTSGAILAVAATLKIYPIIFLFFFVRKKQWRGAISLLAGTATLWLISIGLFGFETVRIYLTQVLPWPLRGEGQDPYNVVWNSFSALLHRLFVAEPVMNPHPMMHLPAGYAFLQPVLQALIFVPLLWLLRSYCSDIGREELDWGAYVAMLLILSTNPASYDFNGLILTAALGVDYLLRLRRRHEAAALIFLYALVCFPIYRWVPSLPTGWRTFLAFPRLWALTGLWICLLVVLSRSAARPLISRLKSREAALFGVIWLVLVAAGITTNLHYQRGEFKSYATRLLPAPGFELATDPSIEGSRVLFTAMTSRGYDTEIADEGSLAHVNFGVDSFHPTTAPGSPVAWVELASRRSSIVQFSLETTRLTPADVVEVAEDAEKPAVSPDRRWLAFIRESKGHGTLWVKALQLEAGGGASIHNEQRVSPGEVDVLDIAFDAADRIIFSARRDGGQPALFTTGPNFRSIFPQTSSSPRRFPAASLDGGWLAFSQMEGGNWQLWVHNFATHKELRLTNSPCNSIAPAWYPDSKHLVYATDCGRGFGLTTLCRIQAVP